MTEQEILQLIRKQKTYYYSGATLPISKRLSALKKLQASIKNHEECIHRALFQDLGKSSFESYMCETGLILSELSYMIRHLRGFAKEKRVPTPLFPVSFQKRPETFSLRNCAGHESHGIILFY